MPSVPSRPEKATLRRPYRSVYCNNLDTIAAECSPIARFAAETDPVQRVSISPSCRCNSSRCSQLRSGGRIASVCPRVIAVFPANRPFLYLSPMPSAQRWTRVARSLEPWDSLRGRSGRSFLLPPNPSRPVAPRLVSPSHRSPGLRQREYGWLIRLAHRVRRAAAIIWAITKVFPVPGGPQTNVISEAHACAMTLC